MEMQQQQQSIHCKVSYNDQFRRFLFFGDDYQLLKTQILTLLELDKQDFVLKYKDNEGDFITISSNEELKCARSFSQDVLRLAVFTPAMEIETPTDPTLLPWRGHGHRGRGRGRGRCRMYQHDSMDTNDLEHVHPYRHGRGGRYGSSEGYGYDRMKAKLISKRDHLKREIDELTHPDTAPFRARLQVKLDRIETRLENMSESDISKDDKTYKKWHKKERKMAKYGAWGEEAAGMNEDYRGGRGEHGCHYQEKKKLPEETLAQIATLKLTLVPFKLTLKTTKNEVKLRKYMLKEAKRLGKSDQSDEVKQLANEISNLKIIKKETITKMDPIKDQIRALKFGSAVRKE